MATISPTKIPASQALARIVDKAGWIGGIGLALLVSALVLLLSLSLPLHEENVQSRDELQRLARAARGASNPDVPKKESAAEIQRRLETFHASLPQESVVNESINQLHELAGKHGFSINNGEYRSLPDKSGSIGRLHISCKTAGSYTGFRAFLREIRQALPALAISRIALTRQKLTETRLEAILEFDLFYLQAGKSRDAKNSR